MTRHCNHALALAAALMATCAAGAENITLKTPENFQVMSVSPNGKWACGVFVDYVQEAYPFRWNLEGGTIEMLGSKAGTAMDVANDGTVSGDFPDTSVLPGGAPVSMPGFWRDGAWHHLQMPEGTTPTDGMGTGISPDGRFMTGALDIDGKYTPFVWKDGEIYRRIEHTDHAVPFAVSPDGEAATGWQMMRNRAATLWEGGQAITFTDSPEYSYSPWSYGRNFSPDGTKVVYWGGWEIEGDDVYLWCAYDRVTGERLRVKSPAYESDLEFYDISNSGMMVGSDRGRGYVWTPGQGGMTIDDYLAARGVDLTGYDDFYDGGDYYVGQLPIFRVVSVSEDENVLALLYYDKLGQMTSMILKIDQDINAVAPAEVSAAQLAGINTVQLVWKRPAGIAAVRGYNVYRDGRKISGFMPINVPEYYDRDLAPGSYTYQVSAVSTTGVETRGEEITVVVAAPAPEAPTALLARQKGINNAFLVWDAPIDDGVHKRYYDPSATDLSGFSVYEPVEVEMAVAFDKDEMANYSDHRLTRVSFVPQAPQRAWTVNIYSRDASGALTLLASCPVDASKLVYRQVNTIDLPQPLEMPDGDLLVAVCASVGEGEGDVIGAENGRVKAGYSDLLRQKSEGAFYSAFDRSTASGMSVSCLSWAIDLTLQKPGAPAATVASYNIDIDGERAGSTAATSFTVPALVDGIHNATVQAVYTDGRVSQTAAAAVAIAGDYPAVTGLAVDPGRDGSTVVTAIWQTSVENDATTVSYTRADKHSGGFMGNEATGYALMAAAEYPASMFRGYEGYTIDTFRFYPLADALFTFILWCDGEPVYELEVPEFALGRWNDVKLPEAVAVKPNCTYTLVLDCFDPEPDKTLVGIDNMPARAFLSDLYSLDNGLSWKSSTMETGRGGNWMIGMVITDPEGAPVTVSGYDVVVDGRVADTVTDTACAYDFGRTDDVEHSLRVDARYPGLDGAVASETVCFYLSVSGIADASIADIRLQQGRNTLTAVGDGITSVSVFAANGTLAAAADGPTADISALAPGVYMVRVATAAGPVTRKIRVTR